MPVQFPIIWIISPTWEIDNERDIYIISQETGRLQNEWEISSTVVNNSYDGESCVNSFWAVYLTRFYFQRFRSEILVSLKHSINSTKTLNTGRIITGRPIGHCGLNSHMFNIGLAEEGTFRFYQEEEETIVHVMCHCESLRRLTFLQIPIKRSRYQKDKARRSTYKTRQGSQ